MIQVSSESAGWIIHCNDFGWLYLSIAFTAWFRHGDSVLQLVTDAAVSVAADSCCSYALALAVAVAIALALFVLLLSLLLLLLLLRFCLICFNSCSCS